MKSGRLIPLLCMGFSVFYCMTSVQAGIPVWSFTQDPDFPARTFVSSTGVATVKYIVTNNSRLSHHLFLSPQIGVSQIGECLLAPKNMPDSSCTLELTINGSMLPGSGLSTGPVMCESANPNECYRPGPADLLSVTKVQNGSILTASTTNLALSIKGLTLNSFASGAPRVITITNNGDAPATGLSVTIPAWPAGTSSISTCGSSLAPGASCTITVTPGVVATSGVGNTPCTNGTAPIPGVVSVTASNAVQTSNTNVVVLGYGCIYQGGFVYAMTETADPSESIGGSVVSTSDQAGGALGNNIFTAEYNGGVVWSSNGLTGHQTPPGTIDTDDVSHDRIPGIDQLSTPLIPDPSFANFLATFVSTYSNPNPFTSQSFQACQGNSDGKCNTDNILVFYNTFITNYTCPPGGPPCNPVLPFVASPGPTPLNYYAAGLCKTNINGYTDWYLPAICEMGQADDASCSINTPNIFNNLPALIGDTGTSCSLGVNCIAGIYWSSTEMELPGSSPQRNSWAWFYASANSGPAPSIFSLASKYRLYGVRCTRALTV